VPIFNRLPKNIIYNYLVSSLEVSSFLGAAFFVVAFLGAVFFVVFSSVFLVSSLEVSSFLGAAFLAGALARAFKDKPILFFLGSKLIILALISSPTLICSLISLTTQ